MPCDLRVAGGEQLLRLSTEARVPRLLVHLPRINFEVRPKLTWKEEHVDKFH